MSGLNSPLLTGIIGVLLCLFGFSLYMAGLKVVGMFLGGTVGALIGVVVGYFARLEGTAALLVILAAAVVGIALGWRFLKTIHGLVVFLIGMGLGFFVWRYILHDFGGFWNESWMPFAAALVGGVAAALLFRYVIILVTAAFGSYLLYRASGQTWVLFVAFAMGLLVQLGFFYRLKLNKRVRADWR